MEDHEPLVFFRDDPNPLVFGVALSRMLLNRGFKPEAAAKSLIFVARTLGTMRLPGPLQNRALILRLRGSVGHLLVLFAGDGQDLLIAPTSPQEATRLQSALHEVSLAWAKENFVVRAPGVVVTKWAEAAVSGSIP